jgi:hypothetical protein
VGSGERLASHQPTRGSGECRKSQTPLVRFAVDSSLRQIAPVEFDFKPPPPSGVWGSAPADSDFWCVLCLKKGAGGTRKMIFLQPTSF